jgi:hypothetical protein
MFTVRSPSHRRRIDASKRAVMADQIVITEKTSQAKDTRAAVGSRYGDILPAEGHLFDLLEPEDDRFRNDAIAPVLNKVGQLTADPVLQKVLGADYCLNLTKLMNTGRKLVVNLSKAKLGDTPSHLLGALLVTALYRRQRVRRGIALRSIKKARVRGPQDSPQPPSWVWR